MKSNGRNRLTCCRLNWIIKRAGADCFPEKADFVKIRIEVVPYSSENVLPNRNIE
jgi:hypothetical protein